MNYKKLGLKLLIFAILSVFLYGYLPLNTYIKIAAITFLIGTGFFLVFFDGFSHMD